MRQSNICARTITVADPNVAVTAPGFTMLNISKAWQYSTGNGVPVAVIDTGVNPSPRLPVVPGGDYIMGGDGLMDCDAHGTIVASLIAAAPQGVPMPAPMPAVPAFPPPAGRRRPTRHHHRRAGRRHRRRRRRRPPPVTITQTKPVRRHRRRHHHRRRTNRPTGPGIRRLTSRTTPRCRRRRRVRPTGWRASRRTR